MDSACPNNAVLQMSATGQWLEHGRFLCPLTLFAVVDKSRGEWFWFDFGSGQWSAVVNQSTLTKSHDFAKRIAAEYSASVEVYSLVRHP
jgi:hypothetical protein